MPATSICCETARLLPCVHATVPERLPPGGRSSRAAAAARAGAVEGLPLHRGRPTAAVMPGSYDVNGKEAELTPAPQEDAMRGCAWVGSSTLLGSGRRSRNYCPTQTLNSVCVPLIRFIIRKTTFLGLKTNEASNCVACFAYFGAGRMQTARAALSLLLGTLCLLFFGCLASCLTVHIPMAGADAAESPSAAASHSCDRCERVRVARMPHSME